MSADNKAILNSTIEALRASGLAVQAMGSLANGEVRFDVHPVGQARPRRTFEGNLASPRLSSFITAAGTLTDPSVPTTQRFRYHPVAQPV